MNQNVQSSLSDCVSAAMLAVAMVSIFASSAEAQTASPRDDEIRKILAERVGAQEGSIGIIIGIVDPQGRRIISFGHRDAGDPRPLDGDTVFEIASVTKVFTALLLADMVQKNEVALGDPVAKHLPAGFKVPTRNGRSITLVDLATHTSGLPFMPENAPPLNDPAAAKYSTADLRKYVADYKLTRDIGADWDYSNLGYWILSEALSARAGIEIQALLRTRVMAPLKMANTDFALSPAMKANLAIGHDAALQPAPTVSSLGIYSLMPAGGGLYSSVNDLSNVLSVAMDYENSPLASALKTCLNTRRPAGGGNEQALGWTVIGKGDNQIIFRDGSSFGFASAIAWNPKKRVGVVALSNQIGSVDDIVRHLLQPDVPLAKPTNTKHTEIAIDSNLLDSYAGRYEAKGEGIFTVAREGDFLTIESPSDWGLPKLRIRPESPRDFFATELPVRVSFRVNSDNHVNGLLIYPPRGQKSVPADRLTSDQK